MNNEQILRQIAYLARSATWSVGRPLFQPGSVVITKDVADVLARSLSMPVCLVYPLDQQPDPEGEEPGLVVQAIGVSVIVRNPGDGTGRAVLLGGNRTATVGEGRGVLEIAAPLLAAIRLGTDANGLRIISAAKGDSGTVKHPDDGFIGWQEHRIEAFATDAKYWHPPTRFVATGGAASVAMTWKLPPTRYDYRRCILRRASGSTAPASATSGSGISLGGTPDGLSAVSVTDTMKWITLAGAPFPGTTTVGEVFTQAVTGATCVLREYDVTALRLYVVSITGSPNDSNVWTGGTNGSVFTPTSLPQFPAGTYSYSLFAAYNDYAVTAATGADAPNTDTTSAGDKDYSDPVTRTVVVS